MEKILIIDDDVTFSLMLRTWLGKKGFGVDTAADIAAGRQLLAEGSYDLVLSDMRLPDGDGTDLLQWIAERGVTVPVIVMTGYAEIRNVFNITGVGKVAGCMVTEGLVKRGAKVRLLRDNVVIHDGNLGQLKRFKEDVKEVKEGYECGMSFENYNDIQVGDFIECYEIEAIAAKL